MLFHFKSAFIEVFLLFLSSATATGSPTHSDPPHLNGEHFRITVLDAGSFLEISATEDGSVEFGGYLIKMIEAVAAKDRANFTFDLLTPSGLGSNCEPQLKSEQDEKVYSAIYRPQYNCGTNDVNDVGGNFSTDMYLGMFYISPERQLRNDFTIPFVPPHKGTPAMYGTATGIRDISDLVEQQKQGKQPAAWIQGSTATLDYVMNSFPGIKIKPFFGSQDELDRELDNGNCEIFIIDAPLAAEQVFRRSQRGYCLANGKPVGVIGEAMSSGLSHYAIGVSRRLPREVVDTLSYWMNILMICNPKDKDGACPEGNLATFYQISGGTGSECDYVLFPPQPTNLVISIGAIVGIVVGAVGFITLIFSSWHYYRLKKQERRYKKRFVQQIARNIEIGPSPGHIKPEKLVEQILHIGQGKSVINKEDLAKWIHDIKMEFISEKDFEALWNAMDVDDKGEVDPVEFIVFLSACGPEFEKVYNSLENMSKIERLKLAARRLTNIAAHGEEGVRRIENKLDRSSREMGPRLNLARTVNVEGERLDMETRLEDSIRDDQDFIGQK